MKEGIRTLGVSLALLAAAALVPATVSGVEAAGAATATNASCGSLKHCGQTVLKVLNADRAHYGLAPLQLALLQSTGRSSCVGSFGHSVAMARSGSIWHDNGQFPRASFPNNICVRYTKAGENVGEADYGNVTQDLQSIDNMMMSEPHDRTTCASTVNHACNILDPTFHHVGIGLVYASGTTWLTEDFYN